MVAIQLLAFLCLLGIANSDSGRQFKIAPLKPAPARDDVAESHLRFTKRQDLVLRTRGFLEFDFYRRPQWYLDVLMKSKTAREAVTLTDEQAKAAETLLKSLKWIGFEAAEKPTPLTAESLRFLRPEQRRWLTTLIVWSEGPMALRHPVVCTEFDVSEPVKKRLWLEVESLAKSAGPPWGLMFGSSNSPEAIERRGDGMKHLYEATFAFEKKSWTEIFTDKERRALLALPEYDRKTVRSILNEVPFRPLMHFGESDEEERKK